MFANWTALYPLLYICGHLATCVSVCLSVGLCTRNVNTQLLGTTNAVCTSPRKWNRELLPHPLGPQTSTFIPDFTWKCEWLFVFQCCATHTHTLIHTAPTYVAPPFFLRSPQPTHVLQSSVLWPGHLHLVLQEEHAQTWEEESSKGIQLSEENTKLGDIIPPLWSCMSYLKHKTAHTRACMHSHTRLIGRSASITSLPQGQGALLAQDLGREQHTQHHSGTHKKQASRKECISYSYLADHSFIQTQSDTVRPE